MSAQQDGDLQACVLAALILHEGGSPITGDKIKTILDASNNSDVQLVYCNIIAKFLQGKDIADLVTHIQTDQQIQDAREGEWEVVTDVDSSEKDRVDHPDY